MSQDTVVKLERLLIEETSGVDRPANELDGWMVMKATGPSFPVGPDGKWDVGAAEKRIRAKTGADDAPNSKYAACFLYKSGDGSKFGDYKFLVCDVVDGDIKVMPAAIRAAASRLPGSTLSGDDKAAVQGKIDSLESKAGIGDKTQKGAEEASSILRKIKELIFPGTSTTEEIEMTEDELNKALDERFAPLSEAVEKLAKSAEATSTEGAAPAANVETTTPDVTVETVTKAIEDGIAAALAPYNEILEKVMDRIEGVEKASAVRKSLDGQESNTSGEGEAKTPTVGDAIAKAFHNPMLGPVGARVAGKDQ